jgi:hypothetical protein
MFTAEIHPTRPPKLQSAEHNPAANETFQNMHDAADDAPVVCPLDAPYIRRQMRFDPSPLLVAQPKQIPAHNPDPLPTTNQDRIVRGKKLMSFDPSLAFSEADFRRLG